MERRFILLQQNQLLGKMCLIYIYIYFLQKSTGKHYKIKYIDNIEKFYEIWNKYQIKYDCNIDRIFDNSKINNVINKSISYTRFEDGCVNCMNNFLDNPSWRRINWKLNFWMNTISNEKIAIWNVIGKREKLRFIKYFFSKQVIIGIKSQIKLLLQYRVSTIKLFEVKKNSIIILY